MHVINDPVLTEYVNRVGKRLASSQEARDSGFPFTFEVVADPSINAFALPGGPMFINTGLLKAVDSEAELAGVMGHEMSHVILRHGTNQASKQQLFQLGAGIGGLAGGGSMLGQLAQVGVGLGANSVLLKFSRNAESQADLMGSHIMAESGYNPLELARFFETLEAKNKKDLVDVPKEVTDTVDIKPVSNIEEVFKLALLPGPSITPAQIEAARPVMVPPPN